MYGPGGGEAMKTIVLTLAVLCVLAGCIKSPLSVCGTPGSCTFNTQATTTVQAPKIDGL